MRLKMLLTVLLAASVTAYAHEDPVVMTIGGQSVSRSEFEYSLNKNNADLEGRKLTPEEYVEPFADYKVVVMAAKAMEPDTLGMLTGLIALDNMPNAPGIEEKARELYDERQESVDKGGGLFLVDDVFVRMGQRATGDERLVAKQRIDALYETLKHEADINTLGIGDSKGDSAIMAGKTSSWISAQDMFPDVADAVRYLSVGQTSEPFLAEDGWHIISLKGKKNYPAFEEMRVRYMNLATQRALAKSIMDSEEDTISTVTVLHTVLKNGIGTAENESAADALNLKYGTQEQLDNYMYLAILSREVLSKREEDETGLQRYFNKNKRKYRWDAPRFKGIAFYAKVKEDIKVAKKALKKLQYSEWTNDLDNLLHNELRHYTIVVIDIFKPGDNPLIDKYVFKEDVKIPEMEGYPVSAVYGKKLKQPRAMDDVRVEVINDYDDELQNDWVKRLRKKYPVVIDKNVLSTVNKH